ncbi:CHAP domain-containing protein [Caldovatus aquaticus]|nr:CHAP domain-containing protein [Caldovatus aquaticus]
MARRAAMPPGVATPERPAQRAAGTGAARGAADGAGRGISCVPYVRQITGMEISGNGRDWWHNAAGLYARGSAPEPGAVLAFPASGGMHLGHVAVVSRVLSAREVLVDHANWAGPGIRRGTVMRGVSVVDVSPGNDWTQVRVQVGWTGGTYGRVYPTYGFIYNRPDPAGGIMLAGRSRGPRLLGTATAAPAGAEAFPASRGGGVSPWIELAEQPAAPSASPHARRHLDLSIRVLETAAR